MKQFLFILLFLCSIVLNAQANPPMTFKIQVKGVNKTLEKQIRSQISLIHLHPDPVISPSVIDFYIDKAKREIALTLQPYGFYNPSIQATKSFAHNEWLVHFQVRPGPPVVVQEIIFQLEGPGKDNSKFSTLRKKLKIKPGDTLNHERYEAGKKALLSALVYKGYLNAEFTTHRIEINPNTHTALIRLTLDTGPRYYFGQTTFGNSALKDSFLQRYLPYAPNAPYAPKKLLTLEDDLRKSGYFDSVHIQSDPDPDTQSVPVFVGLEDQKPNHYLLGFGYGTDTGIRGKAGYVRRRVNSYGHRFETQLQLAQIYQKIEGAYIIPFKKPQTDSIKIYSQYIKDEYSDKPVDSLEVTLSEIRRIYGWDRIVGISFLNEQSVEFLTGDHRHDTLLIPSVELKKIIRDNPTNPTRGKLRLFKIKGALEELASSVTFAQLYFQERWLHTFPHDIKGLFRLELGATFPQTKDKLPMSQRFFAGGDNSLRGFGYRSLPAEIDKDGITQPVGGSYLFITSLELARPVYGPLGVHTFVDMGNAFRNSSDNLQVGVGGGISYDTPLGPIKFSLAKPITNAAHSWRIHATFGPEI